MFNIYISYYNNQNGNLVTKDTLMMTVPISDALGAQITSPTVKCEMGNAESFSFSVEPSSEYYNAFLQMKTYMRVEYDGTMIFYGRVITIDIGVFGSKKITCEGPLAFFNDNFMPGKKESERPKKTVKEYMEEIINDYNDRIKDPRRHFALGEVPGKYSAAITRPQKIEIPTETKKSKKSGAEKTVEKKYTYGTDGWTSTKSALEDLRSHYGGYFRARPVYEYSSNYASNMYTIYLDWMDQYYNSALNTQSIEVGYNIIDCNISTEVDNIFTVLIPMGKKSVKTKTGGTSTDVLYAYENKEMLVKDIVNSYTKEELNNGYHTYEDYANSLDNYGRIVKTVNFDDCTTKTQLRKEAREWIRKNYQGQVTKYSIKAIDMHQIGENTQKILVGDRVKITYPVGAQNSDAPATYKSIYQTCLSITFDLFNPENNQYVFGIPANILTSTYGLGKQSKSVKDTPTTPKSDPSPDDTESEWLDKVKTWLMSHMIFYKGDKPYAEGYDGQYGVSDNAYNDANYFYRAGSLNEHYLYFWTKTGKKFKPGYDPKQEEKLRQSSPYAARQYHDWNVEGYTWSYTRKAFSYPLTKQMLTDSDSIRYIYDTYGINLTNGKVIDAEPPEHLETSDGDKTKLAEIDGQLVTTELITANGTEIHTGDGRTVYSMRDKDGVWHYYYKNKKGEWEETDIETLQIQLINESDRLEALIHKNFAEKYNPKTGKTEFMPHDYQFGIAIEKYGKGKLVVARVDGDVVYIGSEVTQYASMIAQHRTLSICGTVEMRPDKYGIPQVYIVSGGGLRARRGKVDKNGNFTYDENDPNTYTEFGIYDEDTLTAGVITTKINNDNYAFLIGDRVVLGKKQVKDPKTGKMILTDTHVTEVLKEAGVIKGNEDMDGVVFAQKLMVEDFWAETINGAVADIGTIKSDYLETTSLSSELASLDLVSVKSLSATGSVSAMNIFCDNGDIELRSIGGGGYPTWTASAKNHFAREADITYDDSTKEYTLHLYSIAGVEIVPDENSGRTVTFRSYTGGWDAAVEDLELPAGIYSPVDSARSEYNDVNESITFKYPNAFVDGAQETVTYTLRNMLAVGGVNPNFVELYSTKVSESGVPSYSQVARFEHNQWNNGFDQAADYVNLPIPYNASTNDTDKITIQYPIKSGRTQTSVTYVVRSTDNEAYISIQTGAGSQIFNTDYAKVTHGKWNAGFDKAADYVNLPKTYNASTNNTDKITIQYPIKSGRTQTSVTYVLRSTDNEAYISIQTGAGSQIYYTDYAKITHGKYTSGRISGGSAVRGSIHLNVTHANGTTLPYDTDVIAVVYVGDMDANGNMIPPENGETAIASVLWHTPAAPSHSISGSGIMGPFDSVNAFRTAAEITSTNIGPLDMESNKIYGLVVSCGTTSKAYHWRNTHTDPAGEAHNHSALLKCDRMQVQSNGVPRYYFWCDGTDICGLGDSSYAEKTVWWK